MAFTERKISAWTNPVSAEADRPLRSAAEMKAIFDSNSNQLKAALNALIDDLLSPAASGQIGSAPIDRVPGGTVFEQLTALRDYVEGIAIGGGAMVSVNGKTGRSITLTAADVGAAPAPKAFAVILPQSGWTGEGPYSQAVAAQGVTESSLVDVAPAPESFLHWCECAVRAAQQAEGVLSFAAEELPESDLAAFVRVV